MPSLAARVEFAPARSAVSDMAERNGVFRRVEALALAVVAVFTEAVAEAVFTEADTAEGAQL